MTEKCPNPTDESVKNETGVDTGKLRATELSVSLLDEGAVPRKAAEDAFHIAIAARHGMDCLLTWNFRHIANPFLWQRIESTCEKMGYAMPVICTPEQLLTQEDE